MSKLISKAQKSAASAGVVAILSQTPEKVDRFSLALVAGDCDAGLRVNGLSAERVNEYAEDMADLPDLSSFPPIVLVKDGDTYWVSRGNHRVAAALQAGFATFPAHVYTGTKRDAHILALGDNAAHGLRRTRADMQNELRTVLLDPELGKWSDGQIAKIVRCSRKTVTDARAELVNAGDMADDGTRVYIDRYGNEKTMNVAAVQAAKPEPTPLTDEELEVAMRTELARRVTTGRLNDKIAWLVAHRTAAHFVAIIAKSRTTDDEQVRRVADALRAVFEEERDELRRHNEDIARRARSVPSFVPAEPPSGAAADDEGATVPDDAPSAAEPPQPVATGKPASKPMTPAFDGRRLAELLELAAPLIEDLARMAPNDVAAICDADRTVGDLYDLAGLARKLAK